MIPPKANRRPGGSAAKAAKPLAIYGHDDLEVMARRGAAVASLPVRMRAAAIGQHLELYQERLIADFALPPDQLAVAIEAIRTVMEKALAEALQAKRSRDEFPGLLALARRHGAPT